VVQTCALPILVESKYPCLKSISPKYLFNGIQNYGSAYCEKETTNRFVYYHLICRRIFCIERIPKKQLVNNAQEKAEEHLIENYQGIEERSEEHTSELQSRFDLVCR